MKSLFNIRSIALYEITNLLRSWFFRIFSLLAVGIVILINISLFSTSRSPTMFKALPTFIPYLDLLLLNVVQAVIGGFLASDFMKYDTKLDTTDVIYMRSMTNADYVIGKSLGVFTVFGLLNAAVLIVALVFNLFFVDVPVEPAAYVLYPLLISIPTLTFIFGLSFLLMATIRSQALTFIILLGYIATTMFFLGSRFHYLFDYMAFNIPLVYSDITGFADLNGVLMHRGIYFSLGAGCILMTVLFIKRLPQSRIVDGLCVALAIGFFAAGITLGGMYVSRIQEGRALRENMRRLNIEEAERPRVTMERCGLAVEHAGNEISVRADLVFVNKTDAAIDRYLFSLNPGLEIGNIERNAPFTHSRDLHIVTVTPDTPLPPSAADSLTIHYRGTIDEEACYVDVDEEKRLGIFRLLLYNIGKRYAFITPGYVLLTQESLWYPVAGVPYGSAFPRLQDRDFVTFTLRVTTADGLTPVSQGRSTADADGTTLFTPDVRLPQISLAIGRYEKRSIDVEGIEFGVYVIEGHDYFSEFFPDMGEALSEMINDALVGYEDRVGMFYPYERFMIVETPISLYAYPRLWTVTQETVQPEFMLMPEKGVFVMNADFSQRFERMQRMSKRGGRSMTEEEIRENLLGNFVKGTFTGSSFSFSAIRRAISSASNRGLLSGGFRTFLLPDYSGYFSAFPLLYTYSHHFHSEQWPIFPTVMEFHLNDRSEQRPSFLRNITGLSEEERSNLRLEKQPLFELLDRPEDIIDAQNALKTRTKSLFAKIESLVGNEEFRNFIDDYLYEHRFESLDAGDFVEELKAEYDFDLGPSLDTMLHATTLPAFVISEPECYEFIENDRSRYQVTFTVSNTAPVEGVVTAEFRIRSGGAAGGRGGGGRGPFMGQRDAGTEYSFAYLIPGEETRRIGMVLDEKPGAVTINTHVSRNIPSLIEQNFARIERVEDAVPFEGVETVDTPLTLEQPGEIIVDNEDPSFSTRSHVTESYLKRLFDTKDPDTDEYVGMRMWNMPGRWQSTTGSGYYGAIRRSAEFIRAGDGENAAVWTADLPAGGRYDVYYYTSRARSMRFGRGRRGGERGRRESSIKDFHFTVHHDDGSDEVEIDLSKADPGWVHIGTFYFSAGKASVELSDESGGRIVIADAVKWSMRK